MINRKALPPGCSPTLLKNPVTTKTLEGEFKSKAFVTLKDVVLPEFDRNKRINEQPAYVFDGPSRCDVILGRDFSRRIGFKMDFQMNLMQWMNHSVAMKDAMHWDQPSAHLLASDEDEEDLEATLESNASEILDAKYEYVDPLQVAEQQKHLSPTQRKDLANLFSKCNRLFDGTLGHCPHRKVHLEIDPQAQPKHSRAYSVPRAHEEVFKKELKHLVDLGVLSPCGASQWASPTFIIPKVRT